MDNHTDETWRIFIAVCVWRCIHGLAVTYDPKYKEYFKKFLKSLTIIFTCHKCRKNLISNLQILKVDPYLKSSTLLFQWTYLLHDLVNRELGKKSIPINSIEPEYLKLKNKYNWDRFLSGCIWRMIHGFAVTYDMSDEMKEGYKLFINSLVEMLPTVYKNNIKRFIKQYPIDQYFKDNNSLFLWTYLIHDSINKKIGKESPPFEDVKRIYFKMINVECESCKV
jgi:hypothetical protein